LKHAIGNVSVYVAMAHAIGGFKADEIVDAFLTTLKKRRIPEAIIERNRHALEASIGAVTSETFEESGPGDHAATPFGGYGELPVGAQTALRLSQTNRTADYAPSGLRLRFEDPKVACTGCAHCIANCPEGIILWKPDEERGLLVTGVNVNTFCKLCRECIAICPENLFVQVPLQDIWEEATVS
jgi:Pyruvate/2-oxoacid:ferredoxin oxidoreductase delta subunit